MRKIEEVEPKARVCAKGLRMIVCCPHMYCVYENGTSRFLLRLAAKLPRSLEKLDLGLARSGVSNVGLAALDTSRQS